MDWTPYRIERLQRIIRTSADCAQDLQALIGELSETPARESLIEANEHLAQIETRILHVLEGAHLRAELVRSLAELAEEQSMALAEGVR